MQQEYVTIYGEEDETPVQPADFRPPRGLFLVGYLDDRAVACGGWRAHDDGEDGLQAGDADVTQPRRSAHQGAVIVALGPQGCYLLEQGQTSAWSVQPTTPQEVVDRVATR